MWQENIAAGKNIFVYLLDLPRHQGPLAQAYFFNRLKEMSDFLGSQGKAVTAEALQAAVRLYGQTNKLLAESSLLPNPLFPPLQPLAYYDLAAEATAAPRKSINLSLERKLRDNGLQNGKEGQPYLLLTGTIPPRGLLELMEESAPFQLLQENCMTCRYFSAPDPAVLMAAARGRYPRQFSSLLFNKNACPACTIVPAIIYTGSFQGPNLKASSSMTWLCD